MAINSSLEYSNTKKVKMVLNEKIISKHIIKPSSPTPKRIKEHTLSFIEQIAPLVYIPLVFFYQNDELSGFKSGVEIFQLLKESLSRTLSAFYPFAGVVGENSYIDCNGSGVELVESQVHARLTQVIEEPEMEELKQLVPVDSLFHNENNILLVKLNYFDCGGIALGVCISHKVADFAAFVTFMNAWAGTCRGETQVLQPSFDSAVYFPPKPLTQPGFTPEKDKIITKRLVFDKETLEKLRQQAVSSVVKDPTRVEALSVFFWQQFIEACKAESSADKLSFAAHHAINLRSRMIPQMPNNIIGSCSSARFAFTSDCNDLLSKLRVAIRTVDDNYIKHVINTEEYLRTLDEIVEFFKSGMKIFNFTSWLGYPVYDVDFGWGKPNWVCTTTMPYKNLVVMMSTPSMDGIEAWVSVSQDFFLKLETNYIKLIS